MIDSGLLLTVLAAGVVLWLVPRLAKPADAATGNVLDLLAGPALAGLAGGRVVAMALDDPGGLRSLRDIMLVRGGVEFWPGVVLAASGVALMARRDGVSPEVRLADLTPYALLGYATYELGCFVRDGCFGPIVSWGVRPRGVGPPQFPVGALVAAAVVVLALLLRRLPLDRRRLAAGVAGLAAIRYVAAFWLPKLSAGPSRPQIESLAVLLAAAAATGTAWCVTRMSHRPTTPSRS